METLKEDTRQPKANFTHLDKDKQGIKIDSGLQLEILKELIEAFQEERCVIHWLLITQ